MHRAALWGIVGLLLAVAVAVPTANASHTLGHRYIIQGILIDADGNPVQNQELRISTSFQGQTQAVMAVSTHCDGRFYAPEGREIFDAGQGGGHQFIEGPNQQGETYFHYHDADMSTQIQVSFTLSGENWTGPFNPSTRSTVTRHQLSQTFEAASACQGGFEAFHDAFVVHVRSATDGELDTGENVVDARPVRVTITTANGTFTQEGTTNGNGDVWLEYNGTGVAAGDEVRIASQFFGNQSVTVTEEDLRYRYVDRFYTAKEPQPSLWDRFGTMIIILAVIGVVVGGFFAFQKVYEKQEIRKAYERSGRKRTQR